MLPFATGVRGKKKKTTERSDATDYWKYKGDNLSVDQQSQTKLTVKYLEHKGYNTAFGSVSVNNGKHIWKLKIIKKTTKICLGVSSSIETKNTQFHRQKSYANYGYNWDGSKISHKTKYEKYGIPIKTGQIITIILDLNKKQLSFMNNNNNLGIAFNNIVVGETINYRIAVSIIDKDDKIEMIGHGELLHDDDDDNDNDNDNNNENKNEENNELDFNIKDMESWNNKMCLIWIKNIINKQINDINGIDLLQLLNKFETENGIISDYESLKLEYEKQSNILQSLQNKINKLNKKNSKLEKKLNCAIDEKDNLLLLYQVKEKEVQIAKMENQRLRTQLLKLQKSLATK